MQNLRQARLVSESGNDNRHTKSTSLKNNYKFTTVGLIGIPTLFARYIAFNWARTRLVSALRKRWVPPPFIFVDIARMRVHLRDEGPHNDRAPILLLHGVATSLHTWDVWVTELVKTRRIIRFDLPGFGLMGPTAGFNYSFDRTPDSSSAWSKNWESTTFIWMAIPYV